MKKLKYEILRKNILSVSLISLTSKNWTSGENATIPWTGTTYIGPAIGDVVYNNNIISPLVKGYYKWNGTTWVLTTKQNAYDDYNLPLFLEAKADELGVMVGFDGEIEQAEQLCNFVYTANTGNTLTVYNSASNIKLKRIIDATFRINWGDGSATQSIGILSGLTKTYSTAGTKSVSITMTAPWKTETVTKDIKLPLIRNTQQDLANFKYGDYNVVASGLTKTPIALTFVAVGKSRKIEKKLYGSNTYSGVTNTPLPGTSLTCSKYTVNGLDYYDCSDGVTYITGKVPNHVLNETTGFTSYNSNTDFAIEYVTNKMLTRNEHFLGFVTEPVVYSDIFVERGKMGVSEFNLRLGEIDNIGELDIYGNGFFLVKKQ